jgi:energy-coupling factor transport system permease protein
MDLLRSLPIGLYLEQPITWLHRIDPRVKLAWLIAFLLTPIAAHSYWRLGLVGVLLLLTLVTRIPLRVWRKQMGLVLLFSLLLFGVTLFAPDGIDVQHQSRVPEDEFGILAIPEEQAIASPGTPDADPLEEAADPIETFSPLPQPTRYRYVLLDWGILRITQRSLELAIRVGTLTFTLLYSTNLYLLTTAPEEVTAAIENLMQPLGRLGVPVTELALTLTLALRFIPLVLEEVQNLIRAIRTRAINWKKLGIRGSIQVWLTLAERLLENLLLRATQIASAMQVRGFLGADRHQVRWHQFRLRSLDYLVLLLLAGLITGRVIWGGLA